MSMRRSIAPLTIATHPRMIAVEAATVAGCLALLMAFVLGLGARTASAATTYTIQDLGALPGHTVSQAFDVNDSGEVVGQSFPSSPFENPYAFLYSSGQMKDLGTLGGNFSAARGINASGEVVGQSATSSGAPHAFLYSGTQMQDLGTLGGTTRLWGSPKAPLGLRSKGGGGSIGAPTPYSPNVGRDCLMKNR
jgi:probable HAF family extracellular repeat protein